MIRKIVRWYEVNGSLSSRAAMAAGRAVRAAASTSPAAVRRTEAPRNSDVTATLISSLDPVSDRPAAALSNVLVIYG
jgi:hypothetical protein